MIVGDFQLHRALFCPAKAHTALVVDADAVLARPVTAQGFQPVGRRQPQVIQRRRGKQTLQPHSRPPLDVWRQAADRLPVEEPFSVIVPETIHHGIY